MTNATKRLGTKRMSPRKSLISIFVIAAMALGAFGASVASAHGITAHAAKASSAKYRATKSLTDRKSGKPKLTVSVSDKGGRPITAVKVTLPKGFKWDKKTIARDLKVKNHKFTRKANGRALTVKLKKAAAHVAIKVKRGGIKETKKARAAKATKGRVKIKVTEKKAAKQTISTNALTKALNQTSTNLTTIENTVLNKELTQLENDLTSGASVKSIKSLPLIGDLLSTLTKNSATSGIATKLETALKSLSGSKLSSLEGLASVDNGLTSGVKTLTGTFAKLQSTLKKAGVPTSLLAPVGKLVKQIANGLPKTVKQLVSALTVSKPKHPAAALAALQKALEKNVSKYQGDLTKAVGSLVTGLTKVSSSSSSSSALTGIVSKLTSALKLSDSKSGILGTGLSGLVSELGLSLGGLLSDLGLGTTGLGGLGSLL